MSIEIKDRYKYRSVDIATYILAYANEERIYMNITKLQKLLYIVYGAYLYLSDGVRLIDEKPEAWQYGPVFPNVRTYFLNSNLTDIEKSLISNSELEKIEKDETLDTIINATIDQFGDWNASQLSAWSHMEGSPWDKTTNKKSFSWNNNIISDIDIYEYFSTLIKK